MSEYSDYHDDSFNPNQRTPPMPTDTPPAPTTAAEQKTFAQWRDEMHAAIPGLDGMLESMLDERDAERAEELRAIECVQAMEGIADPAAFVKEHAARGAALEGLLWPNILCADDLLMLIQEACSASELEEMMPEVDKLRAAQEAGRLALAST